MKRQIVNVLGFAGIQTQLQVFNSATVMGKQSQTYHMKWNGHGCVPLKFYLQKQELCWILNKIFGSAT